MNLSRSNMAGFFSLFISPSHLCRWKYRIKWISSCRKGPSLNLTLNCVVHNGNACGCCQVLRHITLCPSQTSPKALPWCIGVSGELVRSAAQMWNVTSQRACQGSAECTMSRVPVNVLISHWEEIRLTAWRNGAFKKTSVGRRLDPRMNPPTLHFAWPLPACQWIIHDLSDDHRHEHVCEGVSELGLCLQQLSSFYSINYSIKYLSLFKELSKISSFRRIWVAPTKTKQKKRQSVFKSSKLWAELKQRNRKS